MYPLEDPVESAIDTDQSLKPNVYNKKTKTNITPVIVYYISKKEDTDNLITFNFYIFNNE